MTLAAPALRTIRRAVRLSYCREWTGGCHGGTITEPLTAVPMPTLTIKGMPDPMYRRLKTRARAHRRSLNREILFCLEQGIAVEPPDAMAALARVDKLRKSLRMPSLTSAALDKAKAAGRR